MLKKINFWISLWWFHHFNWFLNQDFLNPRAIRIFFTKTSSIASSKFFQGQMKEILYNRSVYNIVYVFREIQNSILKQFCYHVPFSQSIILKLIYYKRVTSSMCCEYFRVLYWYIIYCLTDNFIKLIKNLKMKIFATIIAIAAATIAISNETKGVCLCCLDLQVVCCTLCLWPDTSADVQARVTDSITTIQVFGGPKWTSRTWQLWTENDHLSYT